MDRIHVAVPPVADRVTTWLFIGSDSRAAAADMATPEAFGSTAEVPGERADVIMLVQEGTGGAGPRLVSIPRDLLVFRVGRGPARLALTLLDAPDGVVGAICRSLGVAVDHVVLVHFDGVSDLVDRLGGVRASARHETRDLHTGLHLPPGDSVLDGAEAVAWVRSRHAEERIDGQWVPDPDGEASRQEHQRALLGQLASKLGSQARNPLRARGLAQTMADALVVDDRADLVDLFRLARLLRREPAETSLPHRFSAGVIPIAKLTPAALPLLDALRGASGPDSPCPRARPQPGR